MNINENDIADMQFEDFLSKTDTRNLARSSLPVFDD